MVTDSDFNFACLMVDSIKELHDVFEQAEKAGFDFYSFADSKQVEYTNWINCQDNLFDYYCNRYS
jgi:alkanesulfonate monooxygenase SsuD/methylene tetrahydromethanopterin reductase-like flavin-dependent oxidoreductase (luciferase family)